MTAPPGPSSATIDLGEISATAGRAAPATGVVPRPPRGVGPRTRRRRLLAALLVPVCLVSLAAASAADRQLGSPLWTARVSLAGFSMGADNLYVSEPGARSIAALEAGTGRLRWRLPLDEPLIEAVDLGRGNVAVITRMPMPNDETGRQNTITSVDPGGRVLAVHHGELLGVLAAGGLALVVMSTSLAVCTDEPGACVDLVAFEPDSGRTVWRIGPVRAGHWFLFSDSDGRIAGVATVGPTGAVMLRDPLTGSVTTTISMPGLLDAGSPLLVSGTLVAVTQGAGQVRLAGRWLSSSEHTWSLTFDVSGPVTEFNRFMYVDSCGGLLCVHIGSRTTVVDADRGSVRFEVPYDIVARLGGGRFLAVPPPGTQVLRPSERTVFVLDGGDGSVRSTLTGGVGVPWPGSGGRALLLRQGRFTEVVLINADGDAARIGHIDGTDLNCIAEGDVLACSEASGRLRVWRLPNV